MHLMENLGVMEQILQLELYLLLEEEVEQEVVMDLK